VIRKQSGLILFLVLIVLSSSAAGQRGRLVISGSGDSQDLMTALASVFERANPGTKIQVSKSIGSSGGIRTVERGEADLGRIARLITEKDRRFNLNHIVFAYSPVVFICNANVKKVDNLTYRQIVDIYAGKIRSWSQLGGEPQPIYVANREEGDSSRDVVNETVPGFQEIQSFAGEVVRTTPENIAIVEKYKNTIGYGPLSMVKGRRLKVLKIEGVYPSLDNVHNGRYSLLTPFSLVWKGRLRGLPKQFIDFIFSPQGRKIIAEHGASPVTKPRE
jgi:phosphate transport system substrate-binding protein